MPKLHNHCLHSCMFVTKTSLLCPFLPKIHPSLRHWCAHDIFTSRVLSHQSSVTTTAYAQVCPWLLHLQFPSPLSVSVFAWCLYPLLLFISAWWLQPVLFLSVQSNITTSVHTQVFVFLECVSSRVCFLKMITPDDLCMQGQHIVTMLLLDVFASGSHGHGQAHGHAQRTRTASERSTASNVGAGGDNHSRRPFHGMFWDDSLCTILLQ